MSDDFSAEDLINVNERYNVAQKKEPVKDQAVSEIVGKDIYITNPRLIKLVAKWKAEKGDDESPDNFLEDPAKVEELKKELS